MSSSVTLNGTTYTIPATGDDGWGDQVSSYLIALSTGVLSKAGGSFTLTGEANLGATYGIKGPYWKTATANPASTGVLRLANGDAVSWRNAANGADLSLSVNGSDQLTFNSNPILTLANGAANTALVMNSGGTAFQWAALTNANIDAAAAIAYSKLALSNSIVNADVASAAAIAYSKLALTGSVVNADIASSAAISLSKLAAVTASRALASDASGVITASTVTDTELGYLSGVTSAVQTQLNAKQATITGGATSITSSDLTVSKALVSDASGKVAASAVTSTELGYVSGVTSALQTQIDSKQATITGAATSITSSDLALSKALVSDGSGKVAASSVTSTELGQLSGLTSTAVGISDTQTLTNKSLTGAKITDYVDLNEQSSAVSAPGVGYDRLYFKNDGKLYKQSSAGAESEIGAGSSGSGEINVVANPSDYAGNWGASGAGVTGATTTTAADLPLDGVVNTAIAVTPVSGTTDYVYYRWTMPAALQNRKLKVEWYQLPDASYASGDLILDVYTNTASDYTGTATALSLSTDSSGDTSIPASTGKFTTTFDADGSDYYELRLTCAAGTSPLYIAQVIVGPGIQPQGAVVESAKAESNITPTNFGVVANQHLFSYRDGDRLIVYGTFEAGTLGSGVKLAIGGNRTINAALLSSATNADVVGKWVRMRSASTNISSTDNWGPIFFDGTDTANLYFAAAVASYSLQKSDTFMASNERLYVEFSTPIAEWAGSGTVNLAQNDVMYASNDGSGGTSATTSYTTGIVSGPGGSALVAVGSSTTTNSATSYKVTFPYPINQVTTKIQTSADSGETWQEDGSGFTTTQRIRQSSANYGMWLLPIDSTSVWVNFGNAGAQPTSATYGNAGQPWSAFTGGTYRWRVVAERAGQAVGFGEVVPGVSSGLVSASGLKGNSAGSAVATGYVGERIGAGVLESSSLSLTNSTAKTITSITLTPGDWDIRGAIGWDNSAATVSDYIACISLNTNTLPPPATRASPSLSGEVRVSNAVSISSNNSSHQIAIPTYQVLVTSTTTFYLVSYSAFSAGTVSSYGYIQARRMS